jgi:glucose-1-phosphate adenylyltransferase
MQHVNVLGLILAGGKGTRLSPLTKERSKPAVPFGGKYRIVDFVLSNFVNSGIYSIYVLTQFKSQSLLQHMGKAWQFSQLLTGQYILPVPAQMRKGEQWYQGTSDAIYQNLHLIELSRPELVAVFGADHIYYMDLRQMVDFHQKKGAKGTVAALPIRVEEAGRFGILEIDSDWRILRFHEKIENPPEIPGRPGWCLASMGNYIFETGVLVSELKRDAARPDSDHDFGKNMLPEIVEEMPIYAYDFHSNVVPGELPENRGYWCDVGTIEAYYEANMDLRSPKPALNVYNYQWPLQTAEYPAGPSKYSADGQGNVGRAMDSVISEGCILYGSEVTKSVLGRKVFVDREATIEESIVMARCHIGAGAKVRRAIIDKNARIPAGAHIGFDEEQDRKRYHVSDTGIVVVEGSRTPIPITPVAV